MKKKLPKPIKSLKSFILEEDAKVIDKTATKVALTASFLALNFAFTIDDANAKGHADHSNHTNILKHVGNDASLANNGDTPIANTYSSAGHTASAEVPPKSVSSAHANHYNHTSSGKK